MPNEYTVNRDATLIGDFVRLMLVLFPQQPLAACVEEVRLRALPRWRVSQQQRRLPVCMTWGNAAHGVLLAAAADIFSFNRDRIPEWIWRSIRVYSAKNREVKERRRRSIFSGPWRNLSRGSLVLSRFKKRKTLKWIVRRLYTVGEYLR